MLVMEQCPRCEKKMPKHILVKHLKKTHGVTSIEEPKKDDTKVVSEEKPTLESTTEGSEPKFVNKYEAIAKAQRGWDWGEIKTCAQCHQEWPDKLMGFHLKFDHGL